MEPKDKGLKSKALLAVVMAGNLLASTNGAFSQVQARTIEAIIHDIANEQKIMPERRAFSLLIFADSLIRDDGVETFYSRYGGSNSDRFGFPRIFNMRVDAMVKSVIDEADISLALRGHPETRKTPESAAYSDRYIKQARLALSECAREIAKVPDVVTRTKMYFIEYHLLERCGETVEAARSRNLVSQEILTAESGKHTSEAQAEAAVSILNLISRKILPIAIPDFEPSSPYSPAKPSSHSALQLADAERIELRTLALVDNLPATSHLRRKTHRDLALWYRTFNENDKYEKQKEILFELVGGKSDHLLYPQAGSCGHQVWWQKEPPSNGFDCGMG